MFGKIVIIATLLAVCSAELPVSAPYAASGWRPQGSPFKLPNSYAAPQRQPALELEVTKERVDYAGQFNGNSALRLSSSYLPPGEIDLPTSVDILRVQGLPSRPIAQFKYVRPAQLNTRERFVQRRPQKFAASIIRVQPAAQYSAPVVQPATQYGAPVAQPATEYGAPLEPVGYPEPRNPDTSNGENEDITDATVTEGEYFILTPEKSLQKVIYRTSQTEEEARTNGFTAQLKYRPVEQVDGPLYKYNEQGQLVKINKK